MYSLNEFHIPVECSDPQKNEPTPILSNTEEYDPIVGFLRYPKSLELFSYSRAHRIIGGFRRFLDLEVHPFRFAWRTNLWNKILEVRMTIHHPWLPNIVWTLPFSCENSRRKGCSNMMESCTGSLRKQFWRCSFYTTAQIRVSVVINLRQSASVIDSWTQQYPTSSVCVKQKSILSSMFPLLSSSSFFPLFSCSSSPSSSSSSAWEDKMAG